MRQFILKIAIYTLILVCSVVILTTALLYFMTPTGDELKKDFIASNIDKMNLLKMTQSPKIIIVGGSNVAFSINSQIIKDSTGLNVVNMGLHAGIGLNFLIEEMLPFVKKGDIVLISPEYSQFESKCFFGGSGLTQLFMINGELWQALKSINWIDDLPITFKTTMRNVIAKITGGEALKESYCRTNFNVFGDYTGHWDKDRIPFETSLLTAKIDKEVIDKLSYFEKQIKEKNAKITFIAPSYCLSGYNKNKEWIKNLDIELKKESISMNFPEHYAFNDTLFYDTDYHMTKIGTEKRTITLIEEYRTFLDGVK